MAQQNPAVMCVVLRKSRNILGSLNMRSQKILILMASLLVAACSLLKPVTLPDMHRYSLALKQGFPSSTAFTHPVVLFSVPRADPVMPAMRWFGWMLETNCIRTRTALG